MSGAQLNIKPTTRRAAEGVSCCETTRRSVSLLVSKPELADKVVGAFRDEDLRTSGRRRAFRGFIESGGAWNRETCISGRWNEPACADHGRTLGRSEHGGLPRWSWSGAIGKSRRAARSGFQARIGFGACLDPGQFGMRNRLGSVGRSAATRGATTFHPALTVAGVRLDVVVRPNGERGGGCLSRYLEREEKNNRGSEHAETISGSHVPSCWVHGRFAFTIKRRESRLMADQRIIFSRQANECQGSRFWWQGLFSPGSRPTGKLDGPALNFGTRARRRQRATDIPPDKIGQRDCGDRACWHRIGRSDSAVLIPFAPRTALEEPSEKALARCNFL